MKRFFNIYGGVIGTLFLFAIVLLPVVAGAQSSGSLNGSSGGLNGSSGSVTSANSRTLDNPLGVNSFCGLVIKLVQAVTVIGIPIAVLFIVWAGFKFVLARGNPGELKTARANFLAVIIGIGIFIGATLIANVIVNTLKDLGVQGINSCT